MFHLFKGFLLDVQIHRFPTPAHATLARTGAWLRDASALTAHDPQANPYYPPMWTMLREGLINPASPM